MGMIKNEDAQFMLLAGFIVAIGLVITTVMLNNIIFEGNMAGEAGADSLKYDVVNLMRINGDEMKSAYRIANGTNESQKRDNFAQQMQSFNSNLSIVYALHGVGVNMTWNINNWNSGIGAQFTQNGTAGSASNWTLIENVRNSTIKLNISSIAPSSTFTINISNSSKNWHIDFTTTGYRIISNDDIRNNITQAYSISFINGSTTSGNYTIIGNTTSGKNFTRSRDHILSSTITLSNSRIRANITIPVSVPW